MSVSVVPKIGAFAALLRFLASAVPRDLVAWPWIVAGIAAVTMTFANLAALRQRSLKRLLAYSSVAPAGYVLLAVAPAARIARADIAVAYYLGAYLFMKLGAFAVVARVERVSGTERLDRDTRSGHRARRGVAPVAVMERWRGAEHLSSRSRAGRSPRTSIPGRAIGEASDGSTS